MRGFSRLSRLWKANAIIPRPTSTNGVMKIERKISGFLFSHELIAIPTKTLVIPFQNNARKRVPRKRPAGVDALSSSSAPSTGATPEEETFGTFGRLGAPGSDAAFGRMARRVAKSSARPASRKDQSEESE
jgi:hypothetical protein